MSAAALAELAQALRAEGGLLADAVREPTGTPLPDGPRGEVDGVLEAIHEGWLLHDGRSRLLDTADPDLALLAGDRLYALGLERLAALGDLDAVRELADVIALCARSHAEATPGLAELAWDEGARAVRREDGAAGAVEAAARAYSTSR